MSSQNGESGILQVGLNDESYISSAQCGFLHPRNHLVDGLFVLSMNGGDISINISLSRELDHGDMNISDTSIQTPEP